MKLRTKFILGTALSIMLMGGAYTTWTEEFKITSKVSTYDFDATINGQDIGTDLEHTVIIDVKDEKASLKIENNGTIPIYVELVEVEYEKASNPNDQNLYKEYKMLTSYQFPNYYRKWYKEKHKNKYKKAFDHLKFDLDDFDHDKWTWNNINELEDHNYYAIEPKPYDDDAPDHSVKEIKFLRWTDFEGMIKERNNGIAKKEVSVKDKEDQIRDYKGKIRKEESKEAEKRNSESISYWRSQKNLLVEHIILLNDEIDEIEDERDALQCVLKDELKVTVKFSMYEPD